MFRSTASFDRLLEKATSKLLLDPDWDSILQIVDSIRQSDVQPSYAVQNIRKKIENENPHVATFALLVLESVVKNCGSLVHIEIANRDFMDFLRDQARKRQDPVKAKVVELIQVWSHAFRNEPSYRIVQDTYNDMIREGVSFPTLKESDAMFLSEKAPDWLDGECCHRCRIQFGLVQRKHHCRACGQIFCNKCSSKTSIVPKFGIEKEVRVCDSCYDVLNRPLSEKRSEDDLPAEYMASTLSKQPQGPPQRSEQEIQEEEELQLALALSQSEQEAKEKERKRSKNTSSYAPASTENNAIYSLPVKQVSAPPAMIDTTDMDPELARYLNRNFWQQKSMDMKSSTTSTTQPSAPLIAAETKVVLSAGGPNSSSREEEKYQNGDIVNGSGDEEREQFLAALRSSIEIFVNRMRSNSQRNRSIANDSSVQTLFMTLTAMHPQLMRHIQDQEDQRTHFETLQDKLAQLKDARDALNVLRDEHREKRRREQEEIERLRQIQMAQKLEALRQKKQELLEYQRQIALQRMQEQEMEMRRRLEMQKQEQQMRAMQYTYPQMYTNNQHDMQQAYPQSIPGTDGSPHHQVHSYGASGYNHPQQQMPMAQIAMGLPPGAQMPSGLQTGYAPAMQGMPGAMNAGSYMNQPPIQVGYAAQGGFQQPGPVQFQGQYIPGPGQNQPPPQPSMEYQPYNMQAVSGALPQMSYVNTGGAAAMPNQYSQGQMISQGHMGPSQLQPGPGSNQAALAELINFD